MKGSRDQVAAREMARQKTCHYVDVVLNQDFLHGFEQHLNRMVHLTDGHYLSQCVVMPSLAKYEELGIKVLLRGHAGELMHMRKAYNFSLNDAALSLRSTAELEAWLHGHLRAYMLDALDEPLFKFADENECNDVAREAMREALRLLTDGSGLSIASGRYS